MTQAEYNIRLTIDNLIQSVKDQDMSLVLTYLQRLAEHVRDFWSEEEALSK